MSPNVEDTNAGGTEADTKAASGNAENRAQRHDRPRLGPVGFLALQAVLILAAVAWGNVRTRELAADAALPPLLEEPLRVTPLYDDPEVVSDEQLRRVLPRLGLRFDGDRTVIGQVDHSLRMWGPDIEFDNPEFMSGKDMLWLLTNQNRFEGVYGRDQEPLLIDEGTGVRVRALEGPASASHVDHTLASLGELGTSLDLPIVIRRAGTGEPDRTTLRAVLEQSLLDFSLNQAEYEWSALAFALYLPPTHRWVTTEGQEITFDRLADRIMREELPNGVCSGNHRLHALVMFLRIDDLMMDGGKPPILTLEGRQRIERYLRGITDTYIEHQHPDGFWNGDWPTTAPAASEPTDQARDRLSTRIIVTGHVLEWWALAPRELLPPRQVMIDAAQWVVRTVDGMTADEIQINNSFLSHAGRALALWRGLLPSEVDLSGNPGTKLARSTDGAEGRDRNAGSGGTSGG